MCSKLHVHIYGNLVSGDKFGGNQDGKRYGQDGRSGDNRFGGGGRFSGDNRLGGDRDKRYVCYNILCGMYLCCTFTFGAPWFLFCKLFLFLGFCLDFLLIDKMTNEHTKAFSMLSKTPNYIFCICSLFLILNYHDSLMQLF